MRATPRKSKTKRVTGAAKIGQLPTLSTPQPCARLINVPRSSKLLGAGAEDRQPNQGKGGADRGGGEGDAEVMTG